MRYENVCLRAKVCDCDVNISMYVPTIRHGGGQATAHSEGIDLVGLALI